MSILKTIYRTIVPLKVRKWLIECYEEYEPPFYYLAKIFYWLSSPRVWCRLFRSKRILFYPEVPSFKYAIYRMCGFLRYKKINNLSSSYDLVFRWEDATIAGKNIENISLKAGVKVINARCTDISKINVLAVFERVFGYSSYIDPLTYQGLAVKKSNFNAQHDGQVIECPIKSEKIEDGVVYQKLIDNRYRDDSVYDIRVPVFGGRITFLYLKYRSINSRFKNYYKTEIITDVDKVLSSAEIEKLVKMADAMGLDYGELDVLRDKSDNKIYVVDVNNTPAAVQMRTLTKRDYFKLLWLWADAFENLVDDKMN